MTEWRRADYWSEVEQDAKSVADLLLDAAEEWTIHGATIAGEQPEEEILHLLTVRSRLGDTGLLLSIRYAVADLDAREVRFTDNGIEMRVNGPITKGLLQMLARTDTEGLAGEQQEPLLLDSCSGPEVEKEPSILTEAIKTAQRSESSEEAEEAADLGYIAEGEHECQRCGAVRSEEDMDDIGAGALGSIWICSEECDE